MIREVRLPTKARRSAMCVRACCARTCVGARVRISVVFCLRACACARARTRAPDWRSTVAQRAPFARRPIGTQPRTRTRAHDWQHRPRRLEARAPCVACHTRARSSRPCTFREPVVCHCDRIRRWVRETTARRAGAQHSWLGRRSPTARDECDGIRRRRVSRARRARAPRRWSRSRESRSTPAPERARWRQKRGLTSQRARAGSTSR